MVGGEVVGGEVVGGEVMVACGRGNGDVRVRSKRFQGRFTMKQRADRRRDSGFWTAVTYAVGATPGPYTNGPTQAGVPYRQ